jgi:hypothetical protein
MCEATQQYVPQLDGSYSCCLQPVSVPADRIQQTPFYAFNEVTLISYDY